jgi:hypothetical protein
LGGAGFFVVMCLPPENPYSAVSLLQSGRLTVSP